MDDLLKEFLTETAESLDVADTELVRFEAEPNNKDILSNIFRLVHTIKGTCGFIGLPRLAALAHAAETLMDKFRQGTPVTPDAVSLVLQTIDRIKEVLGAIETLGGKEPSGSDRDLIGQLEALAAGKAPLPPGQTVGQLIAQTLERPLLPGEESLDDLERAFRETAVEVPVAAPVAAKPELRVAAVAANANTPEAPTPATPASPPALKAVGAGEDPGAVHVSVASQSIRVNVDDLEHLMTMVSELVLTRNQLMEIARRQEESEYKVSLQRLSTVTAELQEAVMRTRMQPIGNAWQKLPRIVRDLARELGKQIELDMVGADTELDRQVLDLIKDPLTHMVRNSADHGLETPEERRAAGKPEKGTIRLSAYHQGGHIIVEIADDGRGLNIDRIRAKARENGLAAEADLAKMSDAQVYRYIFHAGFSTAAAVTSVSGRGVGMDVVRSNIDQIGGSVDVRSTRGKGSTFTIKIPLTLAIMPALIVEAGSERFAIPQVAVIELVAIQTQSEPNIERIKDAPVLRLRDKLLPIVGLRHLLEGDDLLGIGALDRGFIAVMQVGHRRFGLAVDAVLHTEEIVIKPMASMLRHIEMFSGSTILGDGRVIPIVDPNGIARAVESQVDQTEMEAAATEADGSDNGGSISLLLFRAGTPEPKAVPLSLVTRLEEIEISAIERANGRFVILYRGTLIPLVFVNGETATPAGGRLPMLVFTDKGRAMGLVVDEILDIVHESVSVEIPSDLPGSLGAAIIAGRATEVLDIGYYLSQAFPNWFERKAPVDNAHKGRLLVVDDDPIFRKLIDPVLRGVGYNVTLLGSAQQALTHVASGERFDVIISDLDMPVMDGFQFAEALRRDSRYAKTPLVALSSVCSDEAKERGREVGFTNHIAKSDRAGLIAALGNLNDELLGEAA